MRKASYGIIALGLIFGVAIGRADQVTIGADTADQFWDELRSPLAGVIVGVAIRVVGSFAALALAYTRWRGPARLTFRLVRTSAAR